MSTSAVGDRVDTASPAGTRTGGEAPRPSARRWWALAAIGLAQLMVVLDATIVNIALPSAQHELGFDNDGRQWIVTAYSLAFGSLLLLGGRLADLFGRRTTFLIGLVGFAAASALGGAANGFTMLVAARALQGVFGALLAPSALSLLTTTFTDPRERSKAFGIFGAIAGTGGAIGLLLGGLLTEHLDWRWTLYVNDIIAVAAVIGAIAFLSRQPPTRRPKLDVLGTVLVATGLFGVVFGFANAETHAWGDWRCWAFLAAGGALLVLFALWQLKASHPLLPLRVLADRNRAASYLSVFITGTGMFAIFLFLTYYLQQTMGYSPVRTGLAFLPMIGALMVTAQVTTNVLLPRLGPKLLVPAGMVIAGGGLVWLTRLGLDSGYNTHVLPALLALGVGIGTMMPTAMSLATLGVAGHDQGVASAMVNTMQQIGGSIGTALFNTLAATAATGYAEDHAGMERLAEHATIHSYQTAFWWAAGFFAAGLVVAVLLYRRGRPFAHAHTPQHAATAKQDGPAARADEPAPTQPDGVPVPSDAAAPDGATAYQAPAAPDTRPMAPTMANAPAPPQAQGAADEAQAAGPALYGRVLTGGDVPVPGAAVTLIDSTGRQLGRTVTGQDGAYVLRAPSAGAAGSGGPYVLVGSAAGHQPQVATLDLGAAPLGFDLTLGGTGELTGTVRAAGAPLPGAVVVATDQQGEVVGSSTTGPDGVYRLRGLAPGPYTLAVSAAGHRPLAEPVAVEGGAETMRDADLQPVAAVSGTVRGPSGEPLEHARVTLLDSAGELLAQNVTGSDGAYSFTGLEGGDYTVLASGYAPVSATVMVSGPGREDLDLTLGNGTGPGDAAPWSTS